MSYGYTYDISDPYLYWNPLDYIYVYGILDIHSYPDNNSYAYADLYLDSDGDPDVYFTIYFYRNRRSRTGQYAYINSDIFR